LLNKVQPIKKHPVVNTEHSHKDERESSIKIDNESNQQIEVPNNDGSIISKRSEGTRKSVRFEIDNTVVNNEPSTVYPDTVRELIEEPFDYNATFTVTDLTDKRKRLVVKRHTEEPTIGFDYVKCNAVTTEWQDSTFSYLTNPKSLPGQLFYIMKNEDQEFAPETEFEPGSLGRLTPKLVDEFVAEINKKNLLIDFEQYNCMNNLKRTGVSIFSCFLILLGPILFLALRESDDNPGDGLLAGGAAFLLCGFIILGVITLLCGLCLMFPSGRRGEALYYNTKFNEYKEILDKWNRDMFIPVGVHCTTVRNLQYFQFTLTGYVLLVEPHPKPIFARGKFVNMCDSLYELVEPQGNTPYSYENSENDVIVINFNYEANDKRKQHRRSDGNVVSDSEPHQ
jgi:hypothetical protein